MAAGLTYGNQLNVNDASIKRRSSHLSNSNLTLKSSYSPIDDVVYKTGIRGPKKYTLYLVIFILFIIALGNIVTTFVLLGILHLGYGMQSLEFVPSQWVLRILQSANIDIVVPLNGIVGGFEGEALQIIGNDQPIRLTTKAKTPAKLEMNVNQTVLSDVDSFKVIDPNTGQPVFSTERLHFSLSKAVQKLSAQHVVTNKVSSPVNRPLSLASDVQIVMKGTEGMHMTGKEIVLTAAQDLYLRSKNASITLNGTESVMLNVGKLAHVMDDNMQSPIHQYKICVCNPTGKLFRVPVRGKKKINCADALLEGRNPCL